MVYLATCSGNIEAWFKGKATTKKQQFINFYASGFD